MDQLSGASAFLLGLAGTGHCIGMCGPLAAAIPGRTGKFSSHLFYHGGRTVTYVAVGAFMASIGLGLAGIADSLGEDPVSWFSRIQVAFSLAAAGVLLWFAAARIGLVREPSWMSVSSPELVPGYRSVLKRSLSEGKPGGMFMTGMAMGFLPCGLSFAAFARALAAPGPLAGGLLLAAFALGTMPGLLAVGAGASGIFNRYRKHSDILSGLLMIGMGLSLIADALFAFL